MSNFDLYANLVPNMSGGPLLLAGVNPRDDGSPNTYLFEPVQVYGVTAYFTRSTDLGPRVVELDGIGQFVPEPHSVSLLTAGLGMLLLRRKRRTIYSARPSVCCHSRSVASTGRWKP